MTYRCPSCSQYFSIDQNRETNTNNDSLIDQINQWEQTSIAKIRLRAEEQRNILRQTIREYIQNIDNQLCSFDEKIEQIMNEKNFNETMLNSLETQIKGLQQKMNQYPHIEIKPDSTSAFISNISIITSQQNKKNLQFNSHLHWKQQATTIAGGNGEGHNLNQLKWPHGIFVNDQQQSIFIADYKNHRIVEWKTGEHDGQVVAGGNRIDQLKYPTNVIVDQNNKSLIICDHGNRRVVQWSLENQQDKQILISNIQCYGLAMTNNGDLFVSDRENHTVKKLRKGVKEGTIVAGGNGRGDQLNQLNCPTSIFIDREEAIYISDRDNHRVMKWLKDANEGIIVAGGHGQGNSLNQLSSPYGLIVNEVGDIYVADCKNHRIMCWPSKSEEGRMIVGGNSQGEDSNHFNCPIDLAFDFESSLYVVDWGNHRIQRFEVDQN